MKEIPRECQEETPRSHTEPGKSSEGKDVGKQSPDTTATRQLKEGELSPDDAKSLGRLVYQAMFTNLSDDALFKIRFPDGIVRYDPYEEDLGEEVSAERYIDYMAQKFGLNSDVARRWVHRAATELAAATLPRLQERRDEAIAEEKERQEKALAEGQESLWPPSFPVKPIPEEMLEPGYPLTRRIVRAQRVIDDGLSASAKDYHSLLGYATHYGIIPDLTRDSYNYVSRKSSLEL